jgi:hypothetical protein
MPLIAEADVYVSAEPLLQFRRQSQMVFILWSIEDEPEECIQVSLTQSVLPRYVGCFERYRCLEFAGDNARRVVACRAVRRDFGGVQNVVVRSVRLSDHVHLLPEGITVNPSFRIEFNGRSIGAEFSKKHLNFKNVVGAFFLGDYRAKSHVRPMLSERL